jgi:pimeloyl-ACP methyl ester carboxylesterase
MALQTLQLDNGETLAYQTRKSNHPDARIAVLLHGNMSSSLFWDVALDRLPPQYTVYALDLRGFGASSYVRPITQLSDFAQDVKQFSDALRLRSFDLIGWSMGGGVAMQVAADYPELVNKLVLIASISSRGHPYYSSEGGTRLRTGQEIAALSKSGKISRAYEDKDTAFLQALWNQLIYTRNQPEPHRYEAYLQAMLQQRNLLDVYAAMNGFNISLIDHEAGPGTGQAATIWKPTLIIRGTDDKVISQAMTLEIIEDIGNKAKLVSLDDCGHAPQEDQLERLMLEISAFLTDETDETGDSHEAPRKSRAYYRRRRRHWARCRHAVCRRRRQGRHRRLRRCRSGTSCRQLTAVRIGRHRDPG